VSTLDWRYGNIATGSVTYVGYRGYGDCPRIVHKSWQDKNLGAITSKTLGN